MLILFDVDATLLTTGRAGIRAIGRAGRSLYGERFDESKAEYAGRLDPLILHDVLAGNGIEPSQTEISKLKDAYAHNLDEILGEDDADGPGTGAVGLCPGVDELLAALRGRAWSSSDTDAMFVLGLLTGNYEQTGRIKLSACSLNADDFPVRVWGTDSPQLPPSRDQLPGVGIERCMAITGRAYTGEEVVVIGDTPHDIACARAHGCRCIGVATGHSFIDELSHADLAVSTLSDTTTLIDWICNAERNDAGATH